MSQIKQQTIITQQIFHQFLLYYKLRIKTKFCRHKNDFTKCLYTDNAVAFWLKKHCSLVAQKKIVGDVKFLKILMLFRNTFQMRVIFFPVW